MDTLDCAHTLTFSRRAMARTLHELKLKQNSLRELLYERYSNKNISLMMLSRMTEVPYTTLRSFMLGKNVHYMNMIKIEKWLGL